MTKVKILYLCDPEGGYAILREDINKSMSVMMPTGVGVYETSDGRIEIAAMNFVMMSDMFSGIIREVLASAGIRLEKSLEGVIEP